SEAAARTFSLVTADPAEREEPRPESTKEAVARETPAARATSARVTVPRRAGTGAAVPGSSCVRDIVVSPSRSAARRRGSAYRCESTGRGAQNRRSEEHTSELQSRFEIVCRLLLEKKKRMSKVR